MDGVTWFLFGVLVGVFIAIACAAAAFCKSSSKPCGHAPPFRTPPPPTMAGSSGISEHGERNHG
ncbi:hypothetical protein [Halomonas campaniensis]|uniref:Transmembrane protein n=1 Tax=Halomonas campaniensis TaxID=213554 RepID=A0A246RZT9_9GAMM|nr:hypothetical protein [Halomonas campaniensis]OWV29477.1 hypothetical protein JI62_11730 [Halomonas campaniensis]